MITVTDEMVKELRSVVVDGGSIRAGLEAAMKLIDPVPNDVRKARIVSSDWEFTRLMAGEDQDVPTDVWRAECGCHYYTWQQIMLAASEETSEVQWS